MPKTVDYPRSPLKKAIELAAAVDELGGKCTVDLAADRMNMKVSGGFSNIIGAAVKHGLVIKRAGRIETTQLFRDYKLAYTEQEENDVLIKAFMSVPLYSDILERFNGNALPIGHLDRLLVREFDVPEKLSSRVAKYIVDSTKHLGLMGDGDILQLDDSSSKPETVDVDDEEPQCHADAVNVSRSSPRPIQQPILRDHSPDSFTVHVKGPGLDMVVQIDSEFDISLVDMLMQKVKAKLDGASRAKASVESNEDNYGESEH